MSEEPAKYRAEFEAEHPDNRYILAGVPKLFEILEWLALLGAIGYVAKTRNSVVLDIVQFVGFSAICVYCSALLGDNLPHYLPFRRSKSPNVRSLAYLVGGLLGLGASALCGVVVAAIIKSGGLG